MLKIIKYPNNILRAKSRKVKNIQNPEIQKIIAEMKQTMLGSDGLGLAANQINLDLKILIANQNGIATAFINPFIYFKSFKKNFAEEGCLSFPNVYGIVKRPVKIMLFYKDEHGRLRHIKADGLLSRVLQHEIDHLKGVLFIDKITNYTHGEKIVKEFNN